MNFILSVSFKNLATIFKDFVYYLLFWKKCQAHVGDLSYNKNWVWKKQNYECLAKTNFERKLNS